MARSAASIDHSLKVVYPKPLFIYDLPEIQLSAASGGPEEMTRMHAPIKYVEKGLALAANGAWVIFSNLNKIKQRPSFIPKWSDKPLLKSYQKTKPPLGWPRVTDSLCPTCTREARQSILDGKQDVSILLNEKVGEIKATILERDGKILMEKTCPEHGPITDVIAIDPAFLRRVEGLFPGRDVQLTPDALHEHGSSAIKYGRGGVLTVDLTNRCNMMCDPCFMDANQVGFVHELNWDDIKMVLDNAISIKPNAAFIPKWSELPLQKSWQKVKPPLGWPRETD
jgi:hypothetical protein